MRHQGAGCEPRSWLACQNSSKATLFLYQHTPTKALSSGFQTRIRLINNARFTSSLNSIQIEIKIEEATSTESKRRQKANDSLSPALNIESLRRRERGELREQRSTPTKELPLSHWKPDCALYPSAPTIHCPAWRNLNPHIIPFLFIFRFNTFLRHAIKYRRRHSRECI